MKGESFKTWIFRQAINVYPMFLGTGGKVLFLKSDWTHATVRLKLNIWTRNYVGTIFGGSQFAAADPFFMVLLINCIGKEFVVWDKAGAIQFKRPSKDLIKADFIYTPEELKTIRETVMAKGSYEFTKTISWKNAEGKVISNVDKTIYVATKEFYRQRQKEKQAQETTH
jgi:acyl-coenzyme A thioesterase PaaI-like protein